MRNMPVKKTATPAKKVAAKAPVKAAAKPVAKPAAKAPAKAAAKPAAKKIAKGAAYECAVCGLAVTVDEACGCVEACDIICCGKAMAPKKAAAARRRC
jgi:hypothetical protein